MSNEYGSKPIRNEQTGMNTMTFANELIEKLRNGEIMAINNGSLEDLHIILNTASDEHLEIRGHSKYYGFKEGVWYGDNRTILPTVDISLFFLPTPHETPTNNQ